MWNVWQIFELVTKFGQNVDIWPEFVLLMKIANFTKIWVTKSCNYFILLIGMLIKMSIEKHVYSNHDRNLSSPFWKLLP